jgi:Holliday junction resolvase RusA-like endonuclease
VNRIISFFVAGLPQPAGSKRAFALKKGGVYTGRVAISDDNPKARGWKDTVAACAVEACKNYATLLDCPIRLTVEFRLARPQFHFGTGRNAGILRESSPKYPTTRPDCTKMLRAVEDALTAVVWRDDSLIVDQVVTKRYAEKPGAWVEIEALEL